MAARREVVRQLQSQGLSERQALRLVGMSASTLRYRPRDDGNGRLRERSLTDTEAMISAGSGGAALPTPVVVADQCDVRC